MVNAYNFILIISCYFIANLFIVPGLPTIAVEFQADSETVKALMSYYLFGALLSCIIAAFFADYTGKKNFLVFGILMILIGSLLGMFSTNIDMLLMSRALQGFGAATGFMLGFALLVELYDTPTTLKIIALNGTVVSVVCVFVPYFGGVLVDYTSWRITFAATLMAYLIALLISLRYLPTEANNRSAANLVQGLKDVGTIITSRDYLAYSTLNGIFIAGMLYFMTAAPFYFETFYGYGAVENGLMIGLVVWGAFAVGSSISSWFYASFGIDKTIWLGFIFVLSGTLFLVANLLTENPQLLYWLIIAGVGIYCFGFGLVYSGSITGCMKIFPALTTKASAIRTIMLTAGSLLGALFAQLMDDQSVFDLAVFFTSTAIIGLVMFSIRKKVIN